MAKKEINRRGFIAAAAVVIGGGAYAKAEGSSVLDYDTTLGAMLSNKLLAELEPIAMYEFGSTEPKGYVYQGFDEYDKPVAHIDSNLPVEFSFHPRKRGAFDVRVRYTPSAGGIKYRSARRPFRLKYRPKCRHVEVTAWNDCGGCLDAVRKQRIVNAFNAQMRAKKLRTCKTCKEDKRAGLPEGF